MAVFNAFVQVALFVGGVYFVSRAVARNQKSERQRKIGRYVHLWMTSLVALGGVVGLIIPLFDANYSYDFFYEFGGGLMGLGLIVGTVFGNVHGRLRVEDES